MTYRVEMFQHEGYVRVEYADEITREDLEGSRLEAGSALGATGLTRLRAHFPHGMLSTSVGDEYAFTSGHVSRLPRGVRVAIVLPAGAPENHGRFIETSPGTAAWT